MVLRFHSASVAVVPLTLDGIPMVAAPTRVSIVRRKCRIKDIIQSYCMSRNWDATIFAGSEAIGSAGVVPFTARLCDVLSHLPIKGGSFQVRVRFPSGPLPMVQGKSSCTTQEARTEPRSNLGDAGPALKRLRISSRYVEVDAKRGGFHSSTTKATKKYSTVGLFPQRAFAHAMSTPAQIDAAAVRETTTLSCFSHTPLANSTPNLQVTVTGPRDGVRQLLDFQSARGKLHEELVPVFIPTKKQIDYGVFELVRAPCLG